MLRAASGKVSEGRNVCVGRLCGLSVLASPLHSCSGSAAGGGSVGWQAETGVVCLLVG